MTAYHNTNFTVCTHINAVFWWYSSAVESPVLHLPGVFQGTQLSCVEHTLQVYEKNMCIYSILAIKEDEKEPR